LNGIGYWLYTRGEYAAALSTAERIRGVAREFGSRELEILALNLMGVTLTSAGRAEEAAGRLREGIALCEKPAPGLDPALLLVDLECSMRSNLALPLAQRGLFDQSRVERDKAVARADKIGQPMARMLASWCACIVGARLEDEHSVFEHSARLERVVATADVEQGRGPAAWFLGWAAVRRGEPETGFAKIMDGYSFFASLGMFAGCTEVLGYAAEAQLLSGNAGAARQAIDSALDLVERIDERGVLPELLLIRARIERAAGDAATARATIENAIAAALSLDALGSELRARVALADLDERTPADIASLRATYARVTEGFDTPVCTRARDLLAQAQS
jgi:tetratricopeptide (TPR) repeat protein